MSELNVKPAEEIRLDWSIIPIKHYKFPIVNEVALAVERRRWWAKRNTAGAEE